MPLTQTDFGASEALIYALQPLASEEYPLDAFEEFLTDEKSPLELKLFSQWVVDNVEELKSLNIGLCYNYHGGDSYPEIFGVYVDQYFSIPELGATKADFSQITKIEEVLQKLNKYNIKSFHKKLDNTIENKNEKSFVRKI